METTTPDSSQQPSKVGAVWKKTKRILLLFFLLALLIGGGVIYFIYNSCYSEGNRSGTVQKFSKKGVLFKTWEGELILRDFSMQQNSVWTFSVDDPVAASKIDEAMRKGHKVVLNYCEKYKKLPWQGETNYFITKVDEIAQ